MQIPLNSSSWPNPFQSACVRWTVGGPQFFLRSSVGQLPDVLKVDKMLLEELGYKVLTAASPNEAIKQATENQNEISLVITDVVMPDMNGRVLSERLKAFHPNIINTNHLIKQRSFHD